MNSVPKQIALFHQAAVVIGGMLQLVWSKKWTLVSYIIILCYMKCYVMYCISSISSLRHDAIMLVYYIVHGAGLGHMLYMQPNSVVVELAPSENDGRLHLGNTYFSESCVSDWVTLFGCMFCWYL
jgi:hypothetical protein